MAKKSTPRFTPADLTKMVNDHVEDIARLTDETRFTDEFAKHLQIMAAFYDYSAYNIELILMQRPDASRVMGFRKWITLNRSVLKGEKGIAILYPALRKEKDEETDEETGRKRIYFRVGYVFDISQTDGEPLELLEWRGMQTDAALSSALLSFAASKSIRVVYVDNLLGAQGTSAGGTIQLLHTAGTKTLIHELAHELLHWQWREDKSARPARKIAELEAESAAWVISQYAGLENTTSQNYLALWGCSAAEIRASLDRIHAAATEIIRYIDPVLQPKEKELETA